MKVYVLTYEVNAYDQEGEYFAHVFKDCPSVEELLPVLIEHGYIENHWTDDYKKEVATHVLEGRGRKRDEFKWFWLNEVNLK